MKILSSLSRTTIIGIVLVVLAVIAGVIYHFYPRAQVQVTVPPPPPTTTLTAALPFSPMNIVHRREGQEHPMIRQLMADPDLVAGTHVKGIKPFAGDRKDTAKLKKWAGGVAQILAQNAGFIGPHFREEFRVRAPETVAVVIVKDLTGSLMIRQYAVHHGATFAPIATQSVAATSAAAHFIGPQDGTTVLPAPYRQFEYMFVPD
jgi:hypothetical protein